MGVRLSFSAPVRPVSYPRLCDREGPEDQREAKIQGQSAGRSFARRVRRDRKFGRPAAAQTEEQLVRGMDYSPYLFLAVFLLVALGFALLPLGLARFWARKFSPAKPGRTIEESSFFVENCAYAVSLECRAT